MRAAPKAMPGALAGAPGAWVGLGKPERAAARRSILGRAVAAVLGIEVLAALVLIGVTLGYEQHVRFRAFDVMLHGRASALLGAVQDAEDPGDNVVLNRAGLDMPAADLWEVRADTGRVLGRSEHWPAGLDEQFTWASAAVPAAVPPARRAGDAGSQAGLTSRGEPRLDAASVWPVGAGTIVAAMAMETNGQPYRFIAQAGARVVDADEPGGGVLHPVVVLYGAPTRRLRADLLEAGRFYALTFGLVLLLSAAVLALVLRGALAPLRELTEAAGKLSAQQWRFDAPASALETRELAPLSAAMERSVARLERSFEQQRRLTHNAAHELKTDVAIIKSTLQLLSMRVRPVAEYRQGLAASLADCQRLEEAVGQMLTLARVEAQPVGAACYRSDLRGHAAEAVRVLGPMAELRGVRLECSEGTGEAALVGLAPGDCDLLCLNLVQNAVQHSGWGGVVRVGVSADLGADGGWTGMTVEDEGEGIAAEVLPHVFEPFYRGDDARDRKQGGTGLGLAISKAVCERAGGTVRLESAPGRGTMARVRLPGLAGRGSGEGDGGREAGG